MAWKNYGDDNRISLQCIFSFLNNKNGQTFQFAQIMFANDFQLFSWLHPEETNAIDSLLMSSNKYPLLNLWLCVWFDYCFLFSLNCVLILMFFPLSNSKDLWSKSLVIKVWLSSYLKTDLLHLDLLYVRQTCILNPTYFIKIY